MNIFDIDSNGIVETISGVLEDAGAKASEKMMSDIIERIDDALPGIVYLLMNDTKEEWKQEALDSGTGWGKYYAEAIKMKGTGDGGEVYIDESLKKPFMFSMMIEKGVKSWSIKNALLASEKAKTGKDGIKYIIVPFPVATPRKATQGKQLSKFGGREMTSEVHNLVKSGGRAPKGATDISGQDISGLSKWKTDQRHEQYGIFRVVSEKSQGWQYPDTPATPVFNSVKEYVDKRIQEIIHAFCLSVIKEFS